MFPSEVYACKHLCASFGAVHAGFAPDGHGTLHCIVQHKLACEVVSALDNVRASA